MLNRSATFLGIRRGSILEFVKSAAARRNFCQGVPSTSDKSELWKNDAPEQYTVDHFKKLFKTEEDARTCHLILLEIASLHEDTGRAPSKIRERDIKELLLQSTFQRRKYYDYMFKREMALKNADEKKLLARKLREQTPRVPKEPPNGMYPFIRKQSQFKALEGKRLAEAALFGQRIFFDFSFDANMSLRERRNLAEQIQMAYSVNRGHPYPFDLTICNIDKNGEQLEMLGQYFQAESLSSLMIDTTEKSYLDLCPRQDLIYLSPDSPNPLREWDHSVNFIVGGIVDLGQEQPLTLAKAKKDGIACARLPLQERVVLRQGAQKTLTLNTMIEILLTMKTTNDWGIALEKLPRRFIADLGQSQRMLRKVRINRTRKKSIHDMAY